MHARAACSCSWRSPPPQHARCRTVRRAHVCRARVHMPAVEVHVPLGERVGEFGTPVMLIGAAAVMPRRTHARMHMPRALTPCQIRTACTISMPVSTLLLRYAISSPLPRSAGGRGACAAAGLALTPPRGFSTWDQWPDQMEPASGHSVTEAQSRRYMQGIVKYGTSAPPLLSIPSRPPDPFSFRRTCPVD